MQITVLDLEREPLEFDLALDPGAIDYGQELTQKGPLAVQGRAEVIEEYHQRRIRVRVSGPDHRSLLAIVDDSLGKIHRSFPRLHYDRYLPCPCSECP